MPQNNGFNSDAFKKADAAASAYRDKLKAATAGILGVRAGYPVVNGWPAPTPVVVVTYDPKVIAAAGLDIHAIVPHDLNGVPTELVRGTLKPPKPVNPNAAIADAADVAASDADLMNADLLENPQNYDDVRVDEPPAFSAMLSGADINALGEMADDLNADTFAADASTGTRYQRPPNLTLPRFQGPMTLLCHASPDAGWPLLSNFLNGTQEQLTVAMYDFGAPHVLQGVLNAFAGKPQALMHLIIDPGLDATEKAALTTLQAQIPQHHYDQVIASVNKTVGLFKSAFHTKVAVRNHNALWLSSGNWSNNSQPPEDAFSVPPPATPLHFSRNRDFHVIIEDRPALAKTLEDYIEYDRAQSLLNPNPPAHPPKPHVDALKAHVPLLVAEAEAAETMSDKPAPEYFKPKPIFLPLDADLYVQPLLTQDNYIEEILTLIGGAKETIDLQFQYIRWRPDSPMNLLPAPFKELIRLLKQKIDDPNVEVRVIVGRLFDDTRRDLENLLGFEMNLQNFKVQSHVHNKAILVDDVFTVVGSQNWSGDGTCLNRDASLLIRSADVNDYYREIFQHDWDRLADRNIG